MAGNFQAALKSVLLLMGSLYCLRQLLSPSSFVPPAKHCSSPAVQSSYSSHLEAPPKDRLCELCGSVRGVSSSCTTVWLSLPPVCEVLGVWPRAIWKIFLVWKDTKTLLNGCIEEEEADHIDTVKGLVVFSLLQYSVMYFGK